MQLLSINQWFNNDVLKALAWTFVHSLWQGLVAALVAAIIVSITRRTTAKLRYNLLGSVLIVFVATAFITFFIELRQHQQTTASLLQATETVNSIATDQSNTTTVLSEGFAANLTHWFNNNIVLILSAWFLFFLFNCFKLFAGLSSINRLRNYKTHPVSAAWKIKFEQLRNSLGISQPVQLLQSELVKVPVALGHFKPVILLPLGLIANIPAEQVETILLHELGHIRRRDYLVNFLQHFAEAIFFFNPGLRWISSLLRQEREACCDDIAIAKSDQKRNYLDALVAFQEFSVSPAPYAMAISNKPNYLLNRVKRMITNENKNLTMFEKTALLSGLILFSAFTYTSQQKDTKALAITTVFQQFTDKLQFTGTAEEKISIATVPIQISKREKKKSTPLQKPVTDTVPTPVKKDTLIKKIIENKTLPTQKDWENAADAAKTHQEIIKIKEQIGAKKEVIGRKKEQLNSQQEEKDKKATMEQIEKIRKEIDGKRVELDKKRALFEKLKAEEKEKQQEKKEQEQKKKEWQLKQGKNEWNIKPENKPDLSYNYSIDKKVEYNNVKIKEQSLDFKLANKKTLFKTSATKEPLFKNKTTDEEEKKERMREPRTQAPRTSPVAPGKPVAPPMKTMPGGVKAAS